MSKEKFTPGEWTAHLGIMEPTFVHIGKDDDYVDGETTVICELHHGIKKRHPDSVGFDFDTSEMRANAALIAAAPEMYRLLYKLCRKTSHCPYCGSRLTGRKAMMYLDCEKCEINRVLKKARGEE